MNKELTRPDAGTILGVLGVIGLVLIGFILLLLFAVLIGLGAIIGVGNLPAILGIDGLGILTFLKLGALLVLAIFTTRGIFKGEMWSIYATGISIAVTILQSLFVDFSLFGLVISGVMGWLTYTCYLDPYYNQNTSQKKTQKPKV